MPVMPSPPSAATSRALAPAAFLAVLLAGAPATVLAVSSWENEAEPCKRAFTHPDKAPLDRLVYCMRVWATFRTPATISQEDRDLAVPAFQEAFRRGGSQIRYDAQLVLQSLNAPVPKVEASRSAKAQGPKRFVPRACSRTDRQRASGLARKGAAFLKKGRTAPALRHYAEAVETCESHLAATYGHARAAALTGDRELASDRLRRLHDLRKDEAIERLSSARTDEAFVSLRGDPDFRQLTGYVRVKVLNSVGEFGEDETTRIQRLVERLGHEVAERGDDKYRRKRPHLWYAGDARVQAVLFKDVIDHPRTRIKPITWDSEFDVIISWGVVLERDAYGDERPAEEPRSADPDKIDQQVRDLERRQRDALRDPERAASKADRVLGTPDRVEQRGKGAIDRTKRTIDRLEKVGDKLGM